jgi:predicted alpha/beta-fold hydrolase
MFDAFVSNAEVETYTLEAIAVPTLIIHTKDDPARVSRSEPARR